MYSSGLNSRLPLRGVGPAGRRLELGLRLNVKYGFNWAGKNEHFSKVSYKACKDKMSEWMLTWNPRFGIATGINILIKGN